MPLYVHFVKLTRDGAEKIRELPPAYEKFRKFVDSLGGKPACVVACFGEFDFLNIVDYPDQAAALKAAGFATAQGYVRMETVPAYPIEDFFMVMGALPR
ncbi:MAG TPA: GYD domain-containing protein [Candidatus Binataceae bacterium]